MDAVSVIIPTFNRKHTLKRALNSVRKQSLPAAEIIVIDDGSTDDTAQMLEDCFSDVKLIQQENQGVSAARNRGIEIAKGAWLAFLDSDDEWLPEKLEQQISCLRSQPELRVCHTEEIWVRKGVRVNAHNKHKKKAGWIFKDCLALCAMSPSSIIIHESVFNTTGLFDESLPACEDYDLWLRITSRYPVLLIEKPQIIKYGGHEDQLSKKFWGMDRFRITALIKFIESDQAKGHDRQLAIQMLLKKASIFQQGAIKREKWQQASDYQTILDQYSLLLE